jgi:hypothetical protein
MQGISRREFLSQSAAAAVAAGCLMTAKDLEASPLGVPVGCQVFPIREQLMKDFDGTLRQVASIGYRKIEFCSPPSFVSMGFGGEAVPTLGQPMVEPVEKIGRRLSLWMPWRIEGLVSLHVQGRHKE